MSAAVFTAIAATSIAMSANASGGPEITYFGGWCIGIALTFLFGAVITAFTALCGNFKWRTETFLMGPVFIGLVVLGIITFAVGFIHDCMVA